MYAIRSYYAPGNRDALQLNGPGVYNVVIDHVSASWAIDEVFSTWYPVRNVTVSHCLFSEGLAYSRHPKGPHSIVITSYSIHYTKLYDMSEL